MPQAFPKGRSRKFIRALAVPLLLTAAASDPARAETPRDRCLNRCVEAYGDCMPKIPTNSMLGGGAAGIGFSRAMADNMNRMLARCEKNAASCKDRCPQ